MMFSASQRDDIPGKVFLDSGFGGKAGDSKISCVGILPDCIHDFAHW